LEFDYLNITVHGGDRFNMAGYSIDYMAKNSLGTISLSGEKATQSEVLNMCEEYGVCVIDSFLDEETLANIKSDFHDLYNGGVSGVKSHLDEDYQHALNIDWDKVDKSDFSAISELVSNPLFESVTQEYFAEEDVQYPSNLWAAKSKGVPDGPTGDPSDGAPYAYHFDRTNKLKFFFYLSDVELENGPTHVVPEYHKEYKQNRFKWSEDNDYRDISNVIWHYHISGTAEEKEVPITGDTGTLIIFDTDVPHRAGELEVGREREIMRIDTISPTHSALNSSHGSMEDYLKEGVKNPTKAARSLVNKVIE
jgi:ectoine hydroxylase-related dioxygenase (phytanoyl-CoA dioxygenase family)